jgi:HK97 family phage major capsid protein
MQTRELQKRRSKLVADLRHLNDSPTGDNGDLSNDQSAKFTELRSELTSVETRLERQATVDDAERRMEGVHVEGGERDEWADKVSRFSLCRALAAQIEPATVDAGLEIEVGQELNRRANKPAEGIRVPLEALAPAPEKRVGLSTGDAGNLIATDVLAGQFVDALRPASVVGVLGGRVISGLRSNIAIPKLDALTPAAAWVAENSALTADDHSFTQLTAEPHHLGLLTEYSRRTLLQANPEIEQFVRSDFISKLAAGLDVAALSGSGSGATPKGVLSYAGIGQVTTSGTPANMDWDDITEAVATVETANALGGSLGWAVNGWVKRQMRTVLKTASDAGTGFLMSDNGMVEGYRHAITSQLPGDSTPTAGKALFGDFSQVISCLWGDGGADILVNPYESTAYSKGNVQIRAFIDADIIVRHEEAFCVIDGIEI